MLKKRGDISLQIIVLAVIALVVLVVIIMIFTSQATKRAADYETLAQGALKSKCETFLGNRKCAQTNPDPKGELYTEVTRTAEGWPLCDNPADKCWEPKK